MAEADAVHDGAGGSASEQAADDFEFHILSSGGLVPSGAGAAGDMCVADELFSGGKLLPLRPSSAAAGDSPGAVVLLLRSESVASTAGFGSRSDSRSASSSGSSSGCVSRSQSSKSGSSSDHGSAAATVPRRSLSSSVFYAHPSPSPQLRSRPRRSTGSAPPHAAWGIIRLGVVGAPEVYPPRPADPKSAAAAAAGGSGRSARFEQAAGAMDSRRHALDRKHAVGLFGDTFGCKCSPDVVKPVVLPEAARRSRTKEGVKRGQSVRRSRILDWLEELSITKENQKK